MGSWLIDTNILIRALDRRHLHSQLIRRTILQLKRADNRLFIANQNIVEFWAVATRLVESNGLGMNIEWAATQVGRMKRYFGVVPESSETQQEWERLVFANRVSGKKVHDARLVATMKTHGVANILTFNVADFSRYTDVRAISPTEITASA